MDIGRACYDTKTGTTLHCDVNGFLFAEIRYLVPVFPAKDSVGYLVDFVMGQSCFTSPSRRFLHLRHDEVS